MQVTVYDRGRVVHTDDTPKHGDEVLADLAAAGIGTGAMVLLEWGHKRAWYEKQANGWKFRFEVIGSSTGESLESVASAAG